MSSVAVVELIAWVLSALIAGWLVLDMLKVGRRHDEASLVNAPDPLEDPPAGEATEVRSA
ncbi:hypothetical protein Acsp06_52550 [Actinomycetospora sp. NBRC 106375]|uniref:hypothetical protein n=1 Tax=Actinomycetospora sp. NBRC 106375 TaxID=3032207 RepID=UPI00249FCC94|nr:hypothetical protein [Actinomycetospora sp. NBRC 106375]GLZ49070.1 hypothetical protein Acsp06_52550 [Actinomycetospora sp. NBRC 106375]